MVQIAEEPVGPAVDHLELHVPLDVVRDAERDGGVLDALDVLRGPDDALEVLARRGGGGGLGGAGGRGARPPAAGRRRDGPRGPPAACARCPAGAPRCLPGSCRSASSSRPACWSGRRGRRPPRCTSSAGHPPACGSRSAQTSAAFRASCDAFWAPSAVCTWTFACSTRRLACWASPWAFCRSAWAVFAACSAAVARTLAAAIALSASARAVCASAIAALRSVSAQHVQGLQLGVGRLVVLHLVHEHDDAGDERHREDREHDDEHFGEWAQGGTPWTVVSGSDARAYGAREPARESNSVCGRARADWPRFVYDGDPRPGDAAISDSARLPVWGSAGTRRRPTKVTPVQGRFVPTPTANGPRTRELS